MAKNKAAKYAKQARFAARVGVVQNHVAAKRQKRADYQLQVWNYQNWLRQQEELKAQQEQAMLAALPPPVPSGPPQAGWYPDPYDARCVTWWDGREWHPHSTRWA